MARITWEYQPVSRSWSGKVGANVAFMASPSGEAWKLNFAWTGQTFDSLSNVNETRAVAERKLVLFAEQTGLTLPEDVEEENTLAQELIERLRSEVRWFKDADTDQKKAEYVATQALGVFADLVTGQIKALNNTVGGDPEYRGAFTELESLLSLIRDAQEDLGVEVEER